MISHNFPILRNLRALAKVAGNKTQNSNPSAPATKKPVDTSSTGFRFFSDGRKTVRNSTKIVRVELVFVREISSYIDIERIIREKMRKIVRI